MQGSFLRLLCRVDCAVSYHSCCVVSPVLCCLACAVSYHLCCVVSPVEMLSCSALISRQFRDMLLLDFLLDHQQRAHYASILVWVMSAAQCNLLCPHRSATTGKRGCKQSTTRMFCFPIFFRAVRSSLFSCISSLFSCISLYLYQGCKLRLLGNHLASDEPG